MEISMEYLNRNISFNLRRLRICSNLSLGEIAEQTGVSKSMLAQIERGDANPSIGCLEKIVMGLNLELSELLEPPRQEIIHVPKDKSVITKEIANQYVVYTYLPGERNRSFELYGVEIYPSNGYYSASHGERTVEYIIVKTGILEIKVRNRKYELKEGDTFRFESNAEHWYTNKGDDIVQFNIIFCFEE